MSRISSNYSHGDKRMIPHPMLVSSKDVSEYITRDCGIIFLKIPLNMVQTSPMSSNHKQEGSFVYKSCSVLGFSPVSLPQKVTAVHPVLRVKNLPHLQFVITPIRYNSWVSEIHPFLSTSTTTTIIIKL